VLTPTLSVQRNREGRLEWREGTVATSKTTARNSDHSAPRPSKKEIRIVGRSGETTFDGVSIRWRITSQRTFQKPANVAGQEIFDADRIGSRIVLRHWRAGDRFQPIGMFSAVKLQDLFTNQKIARMQRHELVVATTRRGELFWVEKLRIGEAFKLSNSTIRCLHWKWKRL
jgi:tRNA(Ile)-lysidine synthetase-like protein